MKTLAITGLVYCSLVWGATFFVVKDTLSFVHPVTLVGYRFLIASLVMFPFVVKNGLIKKHIKEGLALSSFLVMGYVTQTLGLEYTTASNSGFITALSVLFVPIFLFFLFRRSISKTHWFACFAAAGGLWFLTGGISGFNYGDMLTFICAPAFAFQIIYIDKYLTKGYNLLSLAFYQFFLTGIICLFISLVLGYSFAVTLPKAGTMIVFLAIFPTFSAFFVQLWAQKKIAPVKVGLILSTEPVFAAIFAWTLGGEVLKAKTIIGGLIIMSAILVSELSKFVKRQNLVTEET